MRSEGSASGGPAVLARGEHREPGGPGGRQVELPRLRGRSPEGEVALASFQWAASSDAMDAHTLALVERELPTERSVLFVIDGAKALRRAILEVYGERVIVQRCQVHKKRSLTCPSTRPRRSHGAFDSPSASLGERRLPPCSARALDQRHREPQWLGRAIHPKRQTMARRGDDSVLGQCRSTGCRAAFPTGARLPGYAPTDERVGQPFRPFQTIPKGRV